MKIKEGPGRKLFLAADAAVLVLLALACLAPVLHTFAASFSDPVALAQNHNLLFWPIGQPTVKGYEIVLQNRSILTGYLNTLFYVVAGTLTGVLATAVAAFVFSRRSFLPANFCMLVVSFTMLFNGGLIPTYILVDSLGLINTRLSLILPTAINVFNLIVLKTAFQGIPDSLEESAKLDGAGDLYILFHIYLPLARATVAVIVLFVAVFHWNSWFQASIYLNKRELYPLQIILQEILMQGNISLTGTSADIASSYSLYHTLVQYTTIVVSIVPILCVYPFLQKHFTKGVMVGAIKG